MPPSDEKAELTQMVDRYEAILPAQRPTGQVEKARLDAVGNWADSSSGYFGLSAAWRPKSELYSRLAAARATRTAVANALAPVDKRGTLDFLPGEVKRRGEELADKAGTLAPFAVGGVVILVVLVVFLKVA